MRFLLAIVLLFLVRGCVHDEFIKTVTRVFYDDTPQHKGRLMQSTSSNVGSLRIFADYTTIVSTDLPTINMIKRLVNISTLVFYNMLTVDRLETLYYPANVSPNCSTITIPDQYIRNGIPKTDLAIMISDETNPDGAVYIAKSASCAYLASNNRPIWGVMIWNSKNLKFDQEGFQEIVFVSLHEITHVLGFSALAYDLYPTGNPVIKNGELNYLNSSRINQEVAAHFGCNSNAGLMLEDQDGTLLASHWQRKVTYNEFMTASNSKNTYISRFTLALFETMGWYPTVNYDYAENNLWGKGKGCDFLNLNTCSYSSEFCTKGFGCDFDSTGIGSCRTDIFSNDCSMQKHYTNTICLDPAYPLKNLNIKMNALEVGGWNSRCFNSDMRQRGLNATSLNFRCYAATCSADRQSLFIQVGQSVLVCRTPGQVLKAPLSLTGTLTCPNSFAPYCQSKPTCQNNCNINGICINGQCLCTGSTKFTPGCLVVQLTQQQVGGTGGLLRSVLVSTTLNAPGTSANSAVCFDNFVVQPEFGECVPCSDVYNCRDCNSGGCRKCDNGSPTPNGYC